VKAEVELQTLEFARDLLLGYGVRVRAVEPDELREAVLRSARDIVQLYEGE
jgi:predicted DNA-binding transcriptional regulator YafY